MEKRGQNLKEIQEKITIEENKGHHIVEADVVKELAEKGAKKNCGSNEKDEVRKGNWTIGSK